MHFAADFPLDRVKSMLAGMQNLTGQPIRRLKRIGARPQHLSLGMDTYYGLRATRGPAELNISTSMETAIVALARAGEVVVGKGTFDPARHPTRADLSFKMVDGVAVRATIRIVNSKAKKAGENRRKLEVHLPMTGRFLSPGQALWDLLHVIDPVPAEQAASTPLFRDPSTGKALTVAKIREELRALMRSIGRDGSLYGAHSLRVGGGTALGYLNAPEQSIKLHGRWHSNAYVRYVRSRETEYMQYTAGICSAEVDDFEADREFDEDLDDEDYA